MTNRFKPLPDSLRFPSQNIKNKKKNEIFIVEDIVTNTYNFTLPVISKYICTYFTGRKEIEIPSILFIFQKKKIYNQRNATFKLNFHLLFYYLLDKKKKLKFLQIIYRPFIVYGLLKLEFLIYPFNVLLFYLLRSKKKLKFL